MQVTSNRTGYIIKQPTGYDSFIPNDLPPKTLVPPLRNCYKWIKVKSC
jgi:hypothetical protein